MLLALRMTDARLIGASLGAFLVSFIAFDQHQVGAGEVPIMGGVGHGLDQLEADLGAAGAAHREKLAL